MYLDILKHHTSTLMAEADGWPTSLQDHLHSFGTHVDAIEDLLSQPQLPVSEIQNHLRSLWVELDMLDQGELSHAVIWHLDILRKTLNCISHLFLSHSSAL